VEQKESGCCGRSGKGISCGIEYLQAMPAVI